MTKLQLQNLDQTLKPCDQSEQKLNYMTKLHLPNLHQTVVNTILIINMSNSNNLNKFELSSSHARVTSIKFTKQQSVSELGSHWQALPMIGLGSDKNTCAQIKHVAWQVVLCYITPALRLYLYLRLPSRKLKSKILLSSLDWNSL